MKKSYILLAAVGLILLIAVITNPSQERHKEVLRAKLNASMQNTFKSHQSEESGWGEAGNAIGLMMGGAMIQSLVDNMVSTDNYLVFSVTKITFEGKSRMVGVGAFGNVFLTSQLDKELNLSGR